MSPNPRKPAGAPALAAVVLALSALATPAFAQTAGPPAAAPAARPAAKGDDIAQRLRPTGPVTITARNVDWAKNGLMVYTGDVKLESDTLKLDGDRLELEQLANGNYRARVTGVPASLRHDPAPVAAGTGEAADPPVTARAKTLYYDSQSGVVDVTGNARVTRGEDEVTGETIHYNVNERRIQAAGGSGGQVRIVIQPPPRSGSESKPAGKS